MNDVKQQKSLREVLATDGDLRRKMQSAAALAAYNVLKDAGYSITQNDIDEMKADQTALSVAISENFPATRGDGETIIATGIAIAIATGGF